MSDIVFTGCPACGEPAPQTLFEATLFEKPCPIRKCSRCGLVFKAWFPGPEELSSIYSMNYSAFRAPPVPDPADVNSAKQKLDRCARLLSHSPSRRPRLLDVGCGAGGFVRIARSLGYAADGIDPFLPLGQSDEGLRRASPRDLAAQSYDIVVLLNVAEHSTNPVELFDSVRRLLAPGGVLLITCPYGDSLARRFHKDRWGHLALDEHVLFWTQRSLTRLLREVGFRGKLSVRIAGSPFPFGRGHGPGVGAGSDCGIPPSPSPSPGTSLQQRAWSVARRIQRAERLANLVRHLVHWTRTGDYLEYAIAVS